MWCIYTITKWWSKNKYHIHSRERRSNVSKNVEHKAYEVVGVKLELGQGAFYLSLISACAWSRGPGTWNHRGNKNNLKTRWESCEKPPERCVSGLYKENRRRIHFYQRLSAESQTAARPLSTNRRNKQDRENAGEDRKHTGGKTCPWIRILRERPCVNESGTCAGTINKRAHEQGKTYSFVLSLEHADTACWKTGGAILRNYRIFKRFWSKSVQKLKYIHSRKTNARVQKKKQSYRGNKGYWITQHLRTFLDFL